MNRLIIAFLLMVGIVLSSLGGMRVDYFTSFYGEEYADVLYGDITPGHWHIGIMDCKAASEERDIPMFVMWQEVSCGNCSVIADIMTNPAFVSFIKESVCGQVILCYTTDEFEAASLSQPGVSWVSGGDGGSMPFCRFYWKSKGIDVQFDGHACVDGQGDFQDKAVKALKTKFETYFKDWSGPVTGSRDGQFVVGTDQYDRLEVESGGVGELSIPLANTNVLSKAYTNTLLAVRRIGPQQATTNEYKIGWEASKATQKKIQKISGLNGLAAGETVDLLLKDESGNIVDSSKVFCVERKANSAGNPHWGGEAFGFGEWTMNFAAATNKVATENGNGTLVLFTGTLWCPYCKGLERDVLDTDDFKRYCASNNLALVLLDVPWHPSAPATESPTLLRYARGVVDKSTGRIGSGAEYMSRHNVDEVEAENLLSRTREWAYGKYVDPNYGGLGVSGFDVPYMILLRKEDASVAGRLALSCRKDAQNQPVYDKNSIGDKIVQYDKEATMCRLGELVEQMNEGGEAEAKNDTRSGSTGIGSNETSGKSGFLGANDRYDYWKILAENKTVRVEVSGDQAADVSLSFYDPNGAKISDGVVSGNLATGLVSTVVCGKDAYLLVSAADVTPGSAFFPRSHANSRRAYLVKTSTVPNPLQEEDGYYEEIIAALRELVGVYVEQGRFYEIKSKCGEAPSGVAPAEEFFDAVDGLPDLYVAKATGLASVALEKKTVEQTFSIEFIPTDEIRFLGPEPFTHDVAVATASAFDVVVMREGAGDEDIVASVVLDAADIDPEAERCPYVLGREWEKVDGAWCARIRWQGDDHSPRRIPVGLKQKDGWAFGETKLRFTLRLESHSYARIPTDASSCVFSIIDDDVPNVGHLEIVAAKPAFSRMMQTIVAAGSDVSLEVARKSGFESEVEAKLQLLVGGKVVDEKSMSWQHWDAKPSRIVSFTVPDASRAEVRLVSVGKVEIPILETASVATLVIVSGAGLPAADGDWTEALPLNAKCRHEFALANVAEARVELKTGSLPAGLSGEVQGDKFVVSGIPVRAGSSKAVYQVVAVSGGEVIKRGCTFAVSLDVVAPSSDVSGGDTPYPMLSKAVTYSNIPVVKCLECELGETPQDVKGVLKGMLTVTIPPSGRASAKYISDEGSIAYSASGWERISSEEGLQLKLAGTGQNRLKGMTIDIDAKGVVQAKFSAVSSQESVVLTDPDWGEAGAEAWTGGKGEKGVYTTQLCQRFQPAALYLATGSAGLVVRVAADGKAIYSGFLPNGRSISGAAVLCRGADDGVASLPLLSVSSGLSADVISGVLNLRAGASSMPSGSVRRDVIQDDKGYPRWVRQDRNETETYLEAFGTYFRGKGLSDICKCSLADLSELEFTLNPQNFWSSYGSPADLQMPALIEDNVICIDSSVENPREVQLKYDAENGIVSGTFYLPLRSLVGVALIQVNYRGIVLPGWPSLTRDCGCVLPAVEYPPEPRHIVSGACWFDEDDAQTGLRLRNGCEIYIDKKIPADEGSRE